MQQAVRLVKLASNERPHASSAGASSTARNADYSSAKAEKSENFIFPLMDIDRMTQLMNLMDLGG